MNKIIAEVKAAKRAMELSDKKLKSDLDVIDGKRKVVRDTYSDKINKLATARDQKFNKLETAKEKVYNAARTEQSKIYTPIARFEKIMKLMHVWKNTAGKEIGISQREKQDKEVDVLDTFKDKYLETKFFILETRKPKNKFALIMIGRSIFNEDLIKYPYTYGNESSSYFYGLSINTNIKDAPTKEELVKFYNEKVNNTPFWNKGEHDALVAEYEWVVANCTTKEWDLQYLLSRKYYYEHKCSNGVATKEYAQLLKDIKKLRGK